MAHVFQLMAAQPTGFMTQNNSSFVRQVSQKACSLGEGICYVDEHKTLFWVDIESGSLFGNNLFNGRTFVLSNLDFPSKVLYCGDDSLLILDSRGVICVSIPSFKILDKYEFFSGSNHRSNDGGFDKIGNLWITRMSKSEIFGQGSIYAWDFTETPVIRITDLTIPNTILFPKSDELIFADSYSGSLSTAIMNEKGEVKTVKTLLAPTHLGIPDGSCFDEHGNILNCRWGASCLLRISLKGEIIDRISLPFKYPTSCAYYEGSVYVTSALRDDKSKLAGHVIELRI